MTLSSAVVLVVLLAAAVAGDLRTRRIPNRLMLLGAFAAALLHGFAWVSPGLSSARESLLHGLAGLAVGALILLPGYLLGRTGGGDVKLLAVAGAFLGPAGAAMAGLYAMAFGGPWLLWWLWRARRLAARGASTDRRAPYAPAIACGCALSALQAIGSTGAVRTSWACGALGAA
jgi:Flp pilus assembly protein protease CpaA